MILGGCGATLEELTGLYSIFANNGKFVKLVYTRENFEGSLRKSDPAGSVKGKEQSDSGQGGSGLVREGRRPNDTGKMANTGGKRS